MPELSPMEAFIHQYGNQTHLLQTALGFLKQREEQEHQKQVLEETIRQFDIGAKQSQAKIDQNAQLMKLHINDATERAKQWYVENINQGTIKPGTNEAFTAAPPPSQSANVNIPRSPGDIFSKLGINPSSVPPESIQQPSGYQTPITMNTSYGPIDIGNVVSPQQREAAELSKVGKIADIQSNAYVKKMMPLEQAKLAAAEETWRTRLASSEKIADWKVQNAYELGAMKAAQVHMEDMFKWGLPVDPEARQALIKSHAAAQALGSEDTNEISGPLKLAVENFRSAYGLPAFPGGRKGKVDLTTQASGVTRLMSMFDDYNKTIPAATTYSGKLLNELQAKNPFSKIGQKAQEFKSEAARYALAEGMTPGRLGVKMLQIESGYMPMPKDSPQERRDKELKVLDMGLTFLNGKLSSTSKNPEVRSELWKDILKETGLKDRMALDPSLIDVRDQIVKTGHYDSSMLNPLRSTYARKP